MATEPKELKAIRRTLLYIGDERSLDLTMKGSISGVLKDFQNMVIIEESREEVPVPGEIPLANLSLEEYVKLAEVRQREMPREKRMPENEEEGGW